MIGLLKNPSGRFDRGALYWHYPHFSNQMSHPTGAIRRGEWKLVRSYETAQYELFNIDKDETESKDLSKQHPDIAHKLNRELSQWLISVEANMPILKSTGQAIKK